MPETIPIKGRVRIIEAWAEKAAYLPGGGASELRLDRAVTKSKHVAKYLHG